MDHHPWLLSVHGGRHSTPGRHGFRETHFFFFSSGVTTIRGSSSGVHLHSVDEIAATRTSLIRSIVRVSETVSFGRRARARLEVGRFAGIELSRGGTAAGAAVCARAPLRHGGSRGEVPPL